MRLLRGRQREAVGLCLLGLLIVLGLGWPVLGSDDDAEQPRDLGLLEETRRRLVQIDVTVRGPNASVGDLDRSHFELVVGGRSITDFRVDRLCDLAEPEVPGQPGPPREHEGEAVRLARAGRNIVFYFDQFHLTDTGRRRSYELARELVPRLTGDGSRGMVVSSSQSFRVFADWTADQQQLLRAIDEVESDPDQLDTYPTQEDQRIRMLYAAISDDLTQTASQEHSLRMGAKGLDQQAAAVGSQLARRPSVYSRAALNERRAQARLQRRLQSQAGALNSTKVAMGQVGSFHGETVARQYQQEERWHAQRALVRFSMILAQLAEVDAPKAVVYFADTVRSNPGEHYLGLVGTSLAGKQVNHGASLPVYEEVINEAAAHGVRLYTVQGRGLVASVGPTPLVSRALNRQSHDPLASSRRFDDAENGLVGFALETGGQAFLGASDAERIAGEIRGDLDCPYLISFDPGELPEDRAVPVRIWLSRPDVDVRYRTRLIVKSETKALESRLSQSFFSSERSLAEAGLRVAVIPTGFVKGHYVMLVQVIVLGSTIAPTEWDLGVSAFSRSKLRGEASGRLSVDRPLVPLIFETEVKVAPGPYRIVAVGYETSSDTVVSRRIEGEWPDPRQDASLVGPIALLQPQVGAFSRDGEQRLRGSVALGSGEWIRPDLPTALVALACRDPRAGDDVSVIRELRGDTSAAFSPQPLDPSEQACVLLGDLIDAGTMTSGSFTYEISIRDRADELTSASRSFVAVSPTDAELARQE